MPCSISTACSPSPLGSASRASSPNRPSSCGWRPACSQGPARGAHELGRGTLRPVRLVQQGRLRGGRPSRAATAPPRHRSGRAPRSAPRTRGRRQRRRCRRRWRRRPASWCAWTFAACRPARAGPRWRPRSRPRRGRWPSPGPRARRRCEATRQAASGSGCEAGRPRPSKLRSKRCSATWPSLTLMNRFSTSRRWPRRPRSRACGRARRRRSGGRSCAAASWSNSAEATTGGSGSGRALQREQQHDDRHQRGREGCTVDAKADHERRDANYPLANGRGRGIGSHPARRRRAFGADAAHLSAPQGRLRGRGGSRRSRGARPLRRAAVRSRRPRHHAAEAGRDRGLPAHAQPQPGADHHAHRQGRRDRQGARPRDGRRRLHHQAVLGS